MKKIILNQKCYLDYDEELEFKKQFEKLCINNYEFILFPPILYLTLFKNVNYSIGTQNFFSYNEGSFTGEIALESLKKLGIDHSLVGHFERKKIIGETYSIAKEKLFKSLNSKFYTILCLGEQKKTKRPFNYIKKELNYYLKNIESTNIKYLSIVYEPNWAIGTAEVQCINKINKTITQIKQYVFNKYNIDIEVYYGGSINKDNIKDVLNVSDGVVLGRTSVEIKTIKDMLL